MLLVNTYLTKITEKDLEDERMDKLHSGVAIMIWEQGKILRSDYYLGYGSKYEVTQSNYFYKEK